MNAIRIEYGRQLTFTAADADEWLNDLEEGVDELMHANLGGQECQGGGRMTFAPWAFCAPEIIRGAITHQLLRDKISSKEI